MVKIPIHSHQVSNFTFSVASSRTPPAPQATRKAQCSATTRYQRGIFYHFVETQVTYTAVQNTDLFCWDYGVESVLSYLPLSHVAGQMMDVFLIMSKVLETLLYFISDRCLFKSTFQGWDVLLCWQERSERNPARKHKALQTKQVGIQKNKTLEIFCHVDQNIARFVGVPRVFEKIEEGMKAAGAKSGLKKKVRQKIWKRKQENVQKVQKWKNRLRKCHCFPSTNQQI